MDDFALLSPENGGKSAKQGVITLLWADDSRTGRLRVQNGRFRTYVAGKWRKKCEMGDSALMSPENGEKSAKQGVITLLCADHYLSGRLIVQNGRFRTFVAGKWRKKCEMDDFALISP